MGTRKIKRNKGKSSHSKSTKQNPKVETVPFFLIKEKIKTVEDCVELISSFYSGINVAPESVEAFQNSPLGKFYERKKEDAENNKASREPQG